jgi:hypothetical protein
MTAAPTVAPYPRPIADIGFEGLAGQYIQFISPHTEADPNYMLLYLLCAVGNVIGRGPHVRAGGDRHYTNLYVCAVGSTASGRKGSASGPIERLFEKVDPTWRANIKAGGLSSGEGVIYAVHDAIRGPLKTKEGYVDAVIDPEVRDKRLFIRQTELHGALQSMQRTGNIMSSILRDGWDRGELTSLTKNSPLRASNAHISIVASITPEELRRNMTGEIDNGFANRFLWCCSRQSRFLPSGGRLFDLDLSNFERRFALTIDAAKGERPISRDPEAEDMWGRDGASTGMYIDLCAERPGLFGEATKRAAPQVLRLALVYALLDGQGSIRAQHLRAAREVWRYCEESAAWTFGTGLGNPVANEILEALKSSPQGLKREQIFRNVFHGHRRSEEITSALGELARLDLAECIQCRTAGRPADVWIARNGAQKASYAY